MSRPLILSLCDASGNWSRPYAESGKYDVRCVDLSRGHDVRLMELPAGRVVGVLAAPPCTVFSNAGAWVTRSDDEMREALAVVDACCRIIMSCRPRFWALENPRGTLSRYLGPHAYEFTPSDFGDPFNKRSALWGEFNPPRVRRCIPTLGSWTDHCGGFSAAQQAKRSQTSSAFAQAFFLANDPILERQHELAFAG